jgi:LmbE family N-acetylglucosaminyl deacetylase
MGWRVAASHSRAVGEESSHGVASGAVALVIAAHPDDETFGAGGTIARLARSGIAVHVLAIASTR